MHFALQTPMKLTGNVNFPRVMTTMLDNVKIKGRVAPNGNYLVGMQSFVTSVSVLVTIKLTVTCCSKLDLSCTNHLHNHNLTDYPDHQVGSTSPYAITLVVLLLFDLRVDVLVDPKVARTSGTM